ncbi:MAG: DUF393 domain-containing protein [Gemmatimonadetes bacterium]|nr:DUF393 domain-containing protein [Gemmatimonadota bacterium]
MPAPRDHRPSAPAKAPKGAKPSRQSLTALLEEHGLVLLYDGECGLCDRTVQWVLKRDREGSMRFAPLKSAVGREALARLPRARQRGLRDPRPPRGGVDQVDGGAGAAALRGRGVGLRDGGLPAATRAARLVLRLRGPSPHCLVWAARQLPAPQRRGFGALPDDALTHERRERCPRRLTGHSALRNATARRPLPPPSGARTTRSAARRGSRC